MRKISILVLFALLIGACAPLSLTPQITTEEGTPVVVDYGGTNGEIARRYLAAMNEIGARWSGSAEEAEAGQYIVAAFAQMGYASEFQPFSATGDEGEAIDSANIIAVKEGDSSKVIIVGAHYDSGEEGRGADDNGSGVAVMLAAAGLVADAPTPYTLYFIAFGAEEAGLFGSDAFVSALGAGEIQDIVLFINLDSVSAGDIAYVYSPENEAEARNWAMDWAGTNGYDLQTIRNVDLSDEDGYTTGDHAAFDQAGIAWIYFEATNWNLGDQDGYTQVDTQYGEEGAIIHARYDDLDYLDEVFPGRVDQRLDLFVTVLHALLTQFQMP
ncbi:MAG: M20/M25/M40 family metallo-hydrolase [Anaerolineales bacterium]|nr:M20/M25/M40 family metallo-hydrolase [Anaerolineales bacterium]